MLRVRCFGRVAVEDSGGRELALRSRKHAGLLLYLVSHPRTLHTREDLADLLWEGTGPRERHSLSQAVYDIRSNLDDLLEVTTSSIRLVPDRIAFDGTDFESAVESGAHDRALELYQGDFAPELANLGSEPFDRWVDAERERHRVLASIALRNAQRTAEERGDWDAMCLAALRLVRLNEFDEEAHCALMRGLCMKGDPASALRHYRNLSPELVCRWSTVQALADRLERSGAVREVLTVPSRAMELVGREREFEQLFDAYRRYGRRGGIVAVIGERGVGKTALVREFARLIEARGGTVVWGALEPTQQVAPGTVVISDGERRDSDGSGNVKVQTGFGIITKGLVDIEAPSNHVEQVRLDHLEDKWLVRLVHSHDATVSPASCQQIVRLSSGNPAIATELVAAGWRELDSPRLRGLSTDRLADRCVEGCPQMRQVGEAWLRDLSDGERRVAELIAVLTPAGRAFVRAIAPDQESNDAFDMLSLRDWLVHEDDRVRLRHPLAAAVLRAHLSPDARRSRHRQIAQVLSKGPPTTRLAAAFEWQAAGDQEAASYAAEQIAASALKTGDSVSATRAARLATSTASTMADRVRTALLRAETELQRGRTIRAEEVARSILDLSAVAEVRLEAQLLLSRALLQEGDWDELCASQAIAKDLTTEVADRELRQKADLQLAHVALVAAGRPEYELGRGRDALASDLEAQLREALRFLESLAGPWHEAFRSAFLYRASNTSKDSAEWLLHSFAPAMTNADRGLADLAVMSRLFLQARSGKLRQAVDVAEGLLSGRQRAEDRTRAAVLNNVGVIQTELGQFEIARETLEELRRLDDALALPLADRLTTLLNLAQTEWLASNLSRAAALCGRVLGDAGAVGEQGIEAEATALMGLIALESGHERETLSLCDRLSECRGDLAQDHCLISWLQAEASKLRGQDPVDDLWETASRLAEFDVLAGRKLRVVARRFGLSGDDRLAEAESEARQLRIGGAGWFIRRVQFAGRA